jgi:hypothetical protein
MAQKECWAPASSPERTTLSPRGRYYAQRTRDRVLDCSEASPGSLLPAPLLQRPHETFNDGPHHIPSHSPYCHHRQFRSPIAYLSFPQLHGPENSLICPPTHSAGARPARSGRRRISHAISPLTSRFGASPTATSCDWLLPSNLASKRLSERTGLARGPAASRHPRLTPGHSYRTRTRPPV